MFRGAIKLVWDRRPSAKPGQVGCSLLRNRSEPRDSWPAIQRHCCRLFSDCVQQAEDTWITLDNALTFENHVNDVVKACNYHMRALRRFRRSLTHDVAKTLACSIAGYRIDYCNALLFGATDEVIDKIQHVQNNLASIVNNVSIRQLHQSELNSLDLLRGLHCMPIRSRIEYNISALCYNAYRPNQPSYLASLLTMYASSCLLCSTTQDQLVRFPSDTKTSSRWFSCTAPQVWNNLLASIRRAPSVDSFKMQLKTHLYRLNFQWRT